MSAIETRSKVKETPEQRAKKRNIQITTGVFVLIAAIVVGFYAQTQNANGAFIWAIGLSFGYVLQRSRFCFTAAMRDPILTGGTSLTKALIMALALSSVLYAAMQIKALGFTPASPTWATAKAPGNISPVGLHTVVGGLLFGIGAVIAGGCASGTLMRMGEGFVQQWITIVFFITGSVLGGPVLNWFKSSAILHSGKAIHLPKLFGGWVPALIVQFGVLFALYVLADWYGRKKTGE